MSSENLIQLINVEKSFLTEDVETKALNGINLNIGKGEYVSLSGPSGCGKSTLLSVLGLLDTQTAGQYILGGHDVSDLSRAERAAVRNKQIGFVFQSFNLISDLTIAENVALPLTYRKDMNKSQISEYVQHALERVEMQHRSKHYPSQLSGGQQQRIAVARAIVGSPPLILADEPTGNLDSKNAEIVTSLLERLHQDGATVCIVTHNPEAAKRAQRQISLFDGVIHSDVRGVVVDDDTVIKAPIMAASVGSV
ncbi:ABC transporter ATP-binding protein [Pseudoalteromonas sp. SMS1]|uniref:ABC transporter ATP-binding protein n=1 Tax=Pseudoalteromonas sp. SMS1 TaxID=2908894 RepID=UPI001F3A4747|nr:ABC transporter ATP-binding protein [Pseudoalteromonas sp. SMS1]MCF2856180.1 ABC transporter ATP-binding protein [Pseudoalteromonas sp. SMS1]